LNGKAAMLLADRSFEWKSIVLTIKGLS